MAPPTREPFVWRAELPDAAALDDPQADIAASVCQGKLMVTIAGAPPQEVALPADAFTDSASGRVEGSRLTITIERRDPGGPAMQEKALFNPDRRPVQVAITLPRELLAKSAQKHQTPGGKTPAQLELSEHNPGMYGEPATRHRMPEVNMGSSIVTSMPIITNAGGAVSTVSQGETVVPVPGVAGAAPAGSKAAEGLAAKLRESATVHDQQASGADTVLSGQRERENEAKFDESALRPAAGTAATAVRGQPDAAAEAPAGDDEAAHALATGARGEKVRTDFTSSKVGMEFEERTAADRYVTAESSDNEPISTMKQPGAKCDLCACSPCQCDKMAKTGGTGNDPYELTPAETKRGGRPAIHRPHKQETGVNSHEARDYRGHAGQANPAHVGIGAKLAEFKGNVPDGEGDWSDPKHQQPSHAKHAVHTGGAEIHLDSPSAGGKTTFTTMG